MAVEAAADTGTECDTHGKDGITTDEDPMAVNPPHSEHSSLPERDAVQALVAKLSRTFGGDNDGGDRVGDGDGDDDDDVEDGSHRLLEVALYNVLADICGNDDAERDADEVLRQLLSPFGQRGSDMPTGDASKGRVVVLTARVVSLFLRIYSRSSRRGNLQAGETCCELLRGLWDMHDAHANEPDAAQRYRPSYESYMLTLQAMACAPAVDQASPSRRETSDRPKRRVKDGPNPPAAPTNGALSRAQRAESILNDMERRSFLLSDESLSPSTDCVNLVLYVTKSIR